MLKFVHLKHDMIFKLARRNYKDFSDEELILAFRRLEDKSIIGELYARYGHLVMGCCLKYLKQYENAEDTTIKVFVDLEDKLIRHSIQHFKSWLYQVTKNECLQFLRKRKLNTSELIGEGVSEESDPADIELEKQIDLRIERIPEALQQLKGIQKECVERFYLQQKSYVEIGNELNIPVNTVKSAIQNGKRNIKIWMENHEK